MVEFDIVNDEVKELRTVYHQTIKKVTELIMKTCVLIQQSVK